MTSLDARDRRHSNKASAFKPSASTFFEEIVKEHKMLSAGSELAPHQAKTLVAFEQAIQSQFPQLSSVEVAGQARDLLAIRMSRSVSTEELIKALNEGATVKEIINFSALVDSLASRPEKVDIIATTEQSSAPPYQFKVAANHRTIPYKDWLEELPSVQRSAVIAKLQRVTTESVKSLKPIALEAQLYEVRIFEGPGLRVYIGNVENNYVILIGGRKDKQLLDLLQATTILRDLQSKEPIRKVTDLT